MVKHKSTSSSDWKDKYLTELESQEKKDRLYRQQMDLLIRAVVRISLIAEGIDQTLDKQLVGLRNMLRAEVPSGRELNLMVNALEGQVKRLDVIKAERSKVLKQAFGELIKQLKNINTDKDNKQKLKQLGKSIKIRSTKIQEYSGLINEYAAVQKSVLQAHRDSSSTQPFWSSWFTQQTNSSHGIDVENNIPQDAIQNTSQENSKSDSYLETNTKKEDDNLDESNQKEPPFIRLSSAICGILSDLLKQIEPPEMAKENYQNAKKQLDRGLNWYELVPTLEDISIVVISAFDNYQKEFEQFLVQLNQRLGEADQLISASEKAHGHSIESGKKLNISMREQVSSIQQSMDEATEIDQLKSEVSEKLDYILAAMDQHQQNEQPRENALSDQLNALIDRVKTMEKDSAEAELRIEEQRQKALRDILTQLPNREAYDIRLEQEFERWQRYKRPLSLVVCDIDHFKRVNDTYGHLAGDKVLRIIAKSLAKRLRKTDFIARYGGEEFVILMPETEKSQALVVSDGVRSAIAACPFHFKEEPITITLSFGITEFIDQDNSDSAFLRADKSLYKAKEMGRNCCVLADNPITSPKNE